MTSDEILKGLETRWLGRRIYAYETLDSTNDTAFQLARQGAAEGECVISEYQKKGRGRHGRVWLSPRGQGILLSMILRPPISPAETAKLTLVTGVALVKTAKMTLGRPFGIKWPNDVVFKDKKIGGILTEMRGEPDRVHYVIVGVGVNVNSLPAELPEGATSLRAIAGAEVPRLLFLREFLRQFEEDYGRFKSGHFKELAREWEELSATSGRRVSARTAGRSIDGQALGIDEEGALWIRTDNGLQERVLAGDIEHLR